MHNVTHIYGNTQRLTNELVTLQQDDKWLRYLATNFEHWKNVKPGDDGQAIGSDVDEGSTREPIEAPGVLLPGASNRNL